MEVNSTPDVIVQTTDGPMRWGRAQQKTFISELEEARRYNDFTDDFVVEKVLDVVTIVMTSQFCFPYAKSFLRYLFDRMRRRFRLFKYVIEFPFVNWERATNLMEIPFRIKAVMVYDNPKSARYHDRGEPLWDTMQYLFDKPEIWLEDPLLIVPAAGDGLFFIPPTFVVCDAPLHARIREREYKKLYNSRWSVENYI